MSTTPTFHQNSRSSTGALSQQSTLVPGISRQTTSTAKLPPIHDQALRGAINTFRTRLSAEEVAAFKSTNYQTLSQEILRIQREQERQKEMMHLSRIQTFLEGMQQLGKTVEVFLNVSETVAFIWGPIKFLMLTAATYTDSFETLLNAYESIGETLPLLREYEALDTENPRMRVALTYIYIDILEFHKSALRFFHGKRWIRLFKAVWKDFDTEFKGILDRLRKHKELVKNQATLNYYQRYQEDMKVLQGRLKEVMENETKKHLDAVRAWLAANEQTLIDQERFQKVRQKYSTTTKWIFDKEPVEHWINADVPSTPLLWMHGIPGAGKTILASAVADRCASKAEFTTVYFYCHEGDQSSNTAPNILKGLISQLLNKTSDLLPICVARRATSGEPVLRSLSQAKKLFEDCCFTVPKLFIIVDGLDECDLVERKQVIEVLMNTVSECEKDKEGKLRVLFVSQDYADIRKSLHTTASSRMTPKILQLIENDVKKDISMYVKVWVDEIAKKFDSVEMPFTDDIKKYLRNLTIVNAKGMFLYAELVMQNLYNQPTREAVVIAIKTENFPKGLEEAYQRILQRIRTTSSDEEWRKAKQLLGWMVCAKRQLTWKEIQVALSLDVETQDVEYDDRHLRRHIHDICGSLVLLTGDRITLVHSTAKTFITLTAEGIHEPSIECELAVLCLQYLTFPCFEVDGQDEQQLEQMMLRGHFAFQDYAVAKWFYHINAFVNSGQRFLDHAANRDSYLSNLSLALDDFMGRYEEEDWASGLVQECKKNCAVFENEDLYENLVLITSHIFTFQQKGFEARHKISIKSLDTALERNRKLIEQFSSTKNRTSDDILRYEKFYDEKRVYKCNKITCRYFSEGFTDSKAKKKHINIHDRPFECDVPDCLGAEGFANPKDLEKHNRAFHPERSNLAESFNSVTRKKEKAVFSCSMCGKTFTRNFHKNNHEASHRGLRPYECPECGKAFTRRNDMERHRKLHARGR